MTQTSTETGSRNFYLIAHGCNNLATIDKAFKQKVNGIECDVWADKRKKWWVSHGGTWKTDLLKWLTRIGEAEQKFNRELSIIVFDIKTPQSIKGLRDIINDTLPPGLPHVYSTAKLAKAHIFTEITPLLTTNEVIAIDEEDDPLEVAAFFKKIGATQCWYANGITLIPINDQFHSSMQRAAPLRDSKDPFSKTYTWSVHRKAALRKYIEQDKVDAVIVGLNNILTRPVSNALDIIYNNPKIQLATRKSPLF